jgi:exodeoxyribonuclease III
VHAPIPFRSTGLSSLTSGRFQLLSIYGLNVDAFKAGKTIRFFQQMQSDAADVVCIQETGTDHPEFPQYARLDGYRAIWQYAPAAPGRTGVAILSRHPIQSERRKICDHESCAGRFIEATIGDVKVASVYAHAHDPRDAERRAARLLFYNCLGRYIRAGARDPCIVVLDANVSLVREDVATQTQWSGPWASKTYREPITQALEDAGWKDSFRVLYPAARRATVWTAMNFQGITGEQGYGIDFQLISPKIVPLVREAKIFKPTSWAERFSDHAATLGVYDIDLR